jgi:hypothetical protein
VLKLQRGHRYVSGGDHRGLDAPKFRLGVEACRLVGLDPDQLSLQAPFPEGLPAPMARQSATGSCVRQILQKEVWLWAGNKWDVL